MECRKCKKELPGGAVFCCWCGIRQQPETRKPPKRPNGDGSIVPCKAGGYRAIVRKLNHDGRIISKSKSGFKTQKEAKAYIPELKKALERPGALPERISFAALYDKWVPFYEPRVSLGEMKSAAAAYKHFSPIWDFAFCEVTTAQMQACMDGCGRGKRTMENMKLLASRLYSFAIGERIVAVDYSKPLYTGNGEKKTRPPFTPEEIAKIDQAEREGVPYADYILTMIYTGFRPTEFLTLRDTSYNAAQGLLVAGIKTEAGKDRPIPVHPRIKAIVDRSAARGGLMFPSPDGKELSAEAFRRRIFEPLMAQLGIEGRTPYSSRHSFANMLKDVPGADKDKIALMGHSDKAQTLYYQTADLASLRRIIDAMPAGGQESSQKSPEVSF